MQLRRLGDGFLIGGVIVGAIAAVGYAADIVPDLPPAVLKLVIYKLTFIGGLGLVIFGAFLRRMAGRAGSSAASAVPTSRPNGALDTTPPALNEPMDLEYPWPEASRDPVPVRDRPAR